MSYISSRHTSVLTLDHHWNPWQVLDLIDDSRCVGWAPSKNRKCRHIVNGGDVSTFRRILEEMSSQALDPAALQPDLRELALTGLCRQVHRRSQVETMIDQWTDKINKFLRMTVLQTVPQQRRSYTSSSTISSATVQSSYPALIRSGATSSTISSSTTPAHSEAESLRRSISAMQETIETALRRLERIETPQAPLIEPSRPLGRVETIDISSAHLSTQSSRTLSAASSGSRSTRASIRSPSPTRSTSSLQSVASTSSSGSSPPPSPPAQSAPRSQPTPVRSMNTSSPERDENITEANRNAILVQRMESVWQDLLGSGTLQDAAIRYIATHMPPPISSEPTISPVTTLTTPLCTRTHVRRLPVAEDCPICYETMADRAALVWCRNGCGQSVHRECMDIWVLSCGDSGSQKRCTMCRTAWNSEDDCEC
ncbi:hypothetical protein OPT61_g388 [Boeremia exigua]|uniref:Uncharacterized protein n=1 Tax=Boeremia exigua TaxID=749465 RepID=A0ACC2IUD4_9PLEO|nr:hypothetical protein OPT61_g388 [Boeremia exigua]